MRRGGGVGSNIQETHAYSALLPQELAESNNRGDRKYCVATSDRKEKSLKTFVVTGKKKSLKMTSDSYFTMYAMLLPLF